MTVLYKDRPNIVVLGDSKTQWLRLKLLPADMYKGGKTFAEHIANRFEKMEAEGRIEDLAVELVEKYRRCAVPAIAEGNLYVELLRGSDATMIQLSISDAMYDVAVVNDKLVMDKRLRFFEFLKTQGVIKRELTPRERRKGRYQRKRQQLRDQLNKDN